MNNYKILADDNDSYWNGGPLFDMLPLGKTFKADSPKAAVQKAIRWSRKHKLGWRLRDLHARKCRNLK